MNISEFYSNRMVFANSYPWLFPGGIGDVYDEERGSVGDLSGPVHDLKSWARHLLQYCDGRFSKDHLFILYIHNTLQRHENNREGNFFFKDDKWLGKNQPSLEELKEQIRDGNFTYISKLRYFSQSIRGSDGYWRSKTNELKSWIDYHVSAQHGPPTHFVTLTCAENWWPDLRNIMGDIESIREHDLGRCKQCNVPPKETDLTDANNHDGKDDPPQRNPSRPGCADQVKRPPTCSERLAKSDQRALKRSSRGYTHIVNKYFMKRAKLFMDTYARDVLQLEYYWGRVEFAAGRGQIHLHILGIAKNKAYLHEFHRAGTKEEKAKVLATYATKVLGMTANIQQDVNHAKFDGKNLTTSSPLGRHYTECTNPKQDHIHLVQDSMMHDCSDYCLGEQNIKKPKCRSCRMGFGEEANPNKGDTPGKDNIGNARIEKDKRGIEHLQLPRPNSKRVVQHSKYLLQTWRANADVQLLIYRSDPNMPDVSEIEAVSRYCVAYAGKRYKTTRQEINSIQDVIFR